MATDGDNKLMFNGFQYIKGDYIASELPLVALVAIT